MPIEWLDKPAKTPCIHCDAGCLIHDKKHFECASFECAWLQSGVDNDNLRPDKCGVIFEKVDDATFFGTVAPGAKVSDTARKQMQEFVKQGYTVRLSEQI